MGKIIGWTDAVYDGKTINGTDNFQALGVAVKNVRESSDATGEEVGEAAPTPIEVQQEESFECDMRVDCATEQIVDGNNSFRGDSSSSKEDKVASEAGKLVLASLYYRF